jgi:molybdopterin synthase catalytic subunit
VEDGFFLTETALEPVARERGAPAERDGAVAVFEGWVRDHNQGTAVEGLRYTAYEALAVSEGNAVVSETAERFDLDEVYCVHRLGELAVGEMALYAAVSAPHRRSAFEACAYLVDEIKRRVPVWKEEHYREGKSVWIHPQSTEAKS